MESPFVLYATFTPKPGKEAEAYDACMYSLKALDGAEGLLFYQALKPINPKQPIVLIAHWQSETHFNQAMSSPKAQEVHSSAQLREINQILKPTAEYYQVAAMYHPEG